MPNTLKVEIAHDADRVFIKLIGEARIDIEDAAYQLNRVIVHKPKSIIVDASGLTFISSIGMSLLVNLKRTADKSGGRVKIIGLLPGVYDALARARLIELFDVDPPVPAAPAA